MITQFDILPLRVSCFARAHTHTDKPPATLASLYLAFSTFSRSLSLSAVLSLLQSISVGLTSRVLASEICKLHSADCSRLLDDCTQLGVQAAAAAAEIPATMLPQSSSSHYFRGRNRRNGEQATNKKSPRGQQQQQQLLFLLRVYRPLCRLSTLCGQ